MLQSLAGTLRGLCAAGTGAMLLVGCGKPKDPERFEVFPTRVQLPPNQDVLVTIAAHVRAGDGLIKPGVAIGWTLTVPAPADPASQEIQFPASGEVIAVKLSAGAPAGTRFQLTGTAGSLSQTVELEVGPLGPTPGDLARANHVNGGPPAVALFTAHHGQCYVDSTVAFVMSADLGDWGPGCTLGEPRAAILAPDRAPVSWPGYQWKGMGDPENPDIFDATSVAALTPTDAALERNLAWPYTTVPLRIWSLGVTVDNSLKQRVAEGVFTASGRFTEALAGVAFTYDPGLLPILPGTAKNCTQLEKLLSDNPSWRDPAAMNVYYVPWLIWSRRGYWCGEPPVGPTVDGRPVPPNLILLSMANYSAATLAHELGHAMALMEPWEWRGHADQVSGMTADNLMWAGIEDASASSRYRLSVGQVYRINFDKRSWLNNPLFNAAALDTDCGCNPYQTGPCPRLAADVRPVGNPGATLPGGTCP